eukprot:TRINITY_DN975_c0_g6_i1.p1 TRINITY_DN975_c0_g6~~TRINITY_DN975_c0_g6_i1.p1  ORF type:complete len:297 (-),score=44.76 TRINITY_DN975_c0_g6_i1:117-875(-)
MDPSSDSFSSFKRWLLRRKSYVFVIHLCSISLAVLYPLYFYHFLDAPTTSIDKHYRLHYVLLAVAYGPIMASAMVFNRSFKWLWLRKVGHITLFLGAAVLSVIGMRAIHKAKDQVGETNQHYKSLHAWIGMGTLVLTVLIILMGVALQVAPTSKWYRNGETPPLWCVFARHAHRYLGAATYVLGVSAILTGITAYQPWIGVGTDDYRYRWVNILGVGTAVLAILVFLPFYDVVPKIPQQELTETTQLIRDEA